MGMAVHFFTFHFSPGRYSARYYDEIVHRFCSPGWIAFHLCLLSLVVFHGLNGLWGIVIDFRISKKGRLLAQGKSLGYRNYLIRRRALRFDLVCKAKQQFLIL